MAKNKKTGNPFVAPHECRDITEKLKKEMAKRKKIIYTATGKTGAAPIRWTRSTT